MSEIQFSPYDFPKLGIDDFFFYYIIAPLLLKESGSKIWCAGIMGTDWGEKINDGHGWDKQQGRIHGYRSRVRVGRGHI